MDSFFLLGRSWSLSNEPVPAFFFFHDVPPPMQTRTRENRSRHRLGHTSAGGCPIYVHGVVQRCLNEHAAVSSPASTRTRCLTTHPARPAHRVRSHDTAPRKRVLTIVAVLDIRGVKAPRQGRRTHEQFNRACPNLLLNLAHPTAVMFAFFGSAVCSRNMRMYAHSCGAEEARGCDSFRRQQQKKHRTHRYLPRNLRLVRWRAREDQDGPLEAGGS